MAAERREACEESVNLNIAAVGVPPVSGNVAVSLRGW